MRKSVRLARWFPCTGALPLFLLTGSASAVPIDSVTPGDPGNACDTQSEGCFGAGANVYRISRTEISNAQYAEFPNAKAAADPNGLCDTAMGQNAITRSGSSESFTYDEISGRESKLVSFVSFYDSLRFANWPNNGRGSGDTEMGAYTITALGIAQHDHARRRGRRFPTNEDEWYEAASYDPASTSYLAYPTGSNLQTTCAAPSAAPNTANCSGGFGIDPIDVGSYTGSAGPNGTFDQDGNVREWTEATRNSGRVSRGGSAVATAGALAASFPSPVRVCS